MRALFVNGRMTLADAARTYRYRGNPRAARPDLDALLILLRATLTGIDTAERPLHTPSHGNPT